LSLLFGKVLALISVAGLGLLAGGLWGNRVPLASPPGPAMRLMTYLTQNVAETSEDPVFPELRIRGFPVSAERLYRVAQRAVAELGWQLSETHAERATLRAVITSRLWRFEDDLVAQAVAEGPEASTLHIRSRSRVGKGDLGANLRHILDLQDAVAASLVRGAQ
jgi:hypothetical protein